MRSLLTDFEAGWLNISRRRRRSLIALSAIGFGVVALVLAAGFIEWVLWAMRESMIESRVGHIQVAKRGYQSVGSADPFAYLLPDESWELVTLQSRQHVKAVMPRLSFSGLISKRDATISFIADGVDPNKEDLISRSLIIASGSPLLSSDLNGIILGHGLARILGVRVGDEVVLLANTPSGSINAVEVHVRGTFTSAAKSYDDSALRVPLPLARKLLRVSGSHVWVVLLDDTDRTPEVVEEIRRGLQHSNLEITPWWELTDFYEKTVALFSKQVAVLKLIIATIIVMSISNTMMMSVMERTGEIGTVMALGANRSSVLRLFLVEGVCLGLLGGGIGALLGLALATLISAIGIPMPPPPGMERGYVGEILVSWQLLRDASLLAAGTTLLASVYPSWRASRMAIVDALRHNR